MSPYLKYIVRWLLMMGDTPPGSGVAIPNDKGSGLFTTKDMVIDELTHVRDELCIAVIELFCRGNAGHWVAHAELLRHAVGVIYEAGVEVIVYIGIGPRVLTIYPE